MSLHPNGSHPLHVYKTGTYLYCFDDVQGDEVRARMGDKYFPAKILEIETSPTDPFQNRYYIHFGHVILFIVDHVG